MTEKQRLSLKDAGARLGISESAVRARYKAGKLEGERDNAGKIWVFLNPELQPAKTRPDKPELKAANQGEIAALKEHVSTLKGQVASLTGERDEWRKAAGDAAALRARVEGMQTVIDLLERERGEWRDQAKDTQALIESLRPVPAGGFFGWLKRKPRSAP